MVRLKTCINELSIWVFYFQNRDHSARQFFFGQAQKVMYNLSKIRFYNLLFDCHMIFSTKLLLLSCYMDVKRALWGFDILNNILYNIIERLHLRFFKIFQTLCPVPQI